MEYFSLLFIVLFFVYLIFVLPTKRVKKERKPNGFYILTEKENEARIETSLKDERLFVPTTGSYITLEEAESGEWNVANENGIIPDEVILEHYFGDARETKFIINHLIRKGYKHTELTDEFVETYDALVLLKSLEWSCSEYLNNQETGLGFAKVNLSRPGFVGSHDAILLEIPLPFDAGHCVVKSKVSVTEFLLDAINVETETTGEFDFIVYKKSDQHHYINKVIEGFENNRKLIFEFYNRNLYVIIDFAPTYKEYLEIEETLGF